MNGLAVFRQAVIDLYGDCFQVFLRENYKEMNSRCYSPKNRHFPGVMPEPTWQDGSGRARAAGRPSLFAWTAEPAHVYLCRRMKVKKVKR